MRYYMSDLHFDHANLLTRMDHRPFSSVEEMNEYMIRQWNRKVRRQDEVVILGDFAFSNGERANELLDMLHGRKYLIVGNHDRYFLNDKNFDRTKFEWIKEYAELNDNKRGIVLCHYPIICYNGQYRKDQFGVPKRYMLYGHVHNTRDEININRFISETRQTEYVDSHSESGEIVNIPCNMINTFCMFSDYIPLTLDEWIAVDRRRREEMDGNAKC